MAFKKKAATPAPPKLPEVKAEPKSEPKPAAKTHVSRELAQNLVKHCGDIRFHKLHPANRKVQDMILALADSFGE